MLKKVICVIWLLTFISHLHCKSSDSTVKAFDWDVFPTAERDHWRSMVKNHLNKLAQAQFSQRDETWKKMTDWNKWLLQRDEYRTNFKKRMGLEEHSLSPLNPRVSTAYEDAEVRIENILYESLPRFYVTANAYIPKGKPDSKSKLPAVIRIVGHSMNGKASPKKWCMEIARRGYFVFVIDLVGQGERIYINQGEGFHSPTRDHFSQGAACTLTDSNLAGYMINDIIRAIDYLETRPEVDMKRVVLTGESGGGTVASYVSAFEERLVGTAIVSALGPDRGESSGNYDSEQILFDKINGGFDVETRASMAAPLPYRIIKEVKADKEESHTQSPPTIADFKHVQQIFGLKKARSNFEFIPTQFPHGYGQGHTALFIEWLSKVNPSWTNAKPFSAADRVTKEMLQVTQTGRVYFTPELAGCETVFSLNSRRITLQNAFKNSMKLEELKDHRSAFTRRLRDLLLIQNSQKSLPAKHRSTHSVEGFSVEKIVLNPEDGVQIPTLLLKPSPKSAGKLPAVVWFSARGKQNLIRNRWSEIRDILNAGSAVLIPDLRGFGETSPSDKLLFTGEETCLNGLSYSIGRPLIGMRVRDCLACFEYLRERPDIDAQQIAIIGDSLSTVNPTPIKKLQLLEEEEENPQLSNADSVGPIVALLTFGLDDKLTACVIRGGLNSYESLCNDGYFYHPFAAFIPGILRMGDVADICALAAPRPLLMTQTVNAQNQLIPKEKIKSSFERTTNIYRIQNASERFRIEQDGSDSLLKDFIFKSFKKSESKRP